MSVEVQIINIDDIDIDEEFNCRGMFNKLDVADLAKDIEQQTASNPETMGLLSPVIVRVLDAEEQAKTRKRYGLVAGFRRTFAFKVLKRTQIPCLVKEHMSADQAAITNLTENLQRKDLNILQEANAIKRLKDHGHKPQAIASALGVSVGWIQVRFNLLDLPPEIQLEAAAGILNQHHIKKLYTLKDPEKQFAAVRKIKDHKLKDNRAADLVIAKDKEQPLTKKVRNRPQIFDLINHLGDTIGYGLATRCLAWAAGELTNLELLQTIRDEAQAKGIDYTINSDGTIPESTVSV
jgi:ParB/RepB/Spo0J family partition protein